MAVSQRSIWSNRHGEEATVDDDVFAGDETAGVWSGHQHDSSCEFAGNSERAARIIAKLSARWSVVSDAFDSFRCENFAVLFSREEAWRQSVDSDSVLGEFAAEVLRQIDDRALRSGVSEDSRQRHDTAERRDVDD